MFVGNFYAKRNFAAARMRLRTYMSIAVNYVLSLLRQILLSVASNCLRPAAHVCGLQPCENSARRDADVQVSVRRRAVPLLSAVLRIGSGRIAKVM